MNRKQRRESQKKMKKENKEMAQKVALFGKLSDHCDACLIEFDKTDREMVATWNVVVRKEEEIVRLYCPTCWGTAVKIAKEYEENETNTEL